MTQCNRDQAGPNGRGRGTGESQFSTRTEIKSEGLREKGLISARYEIGASSVPRPLADDGDEDDLDHFLASNPAQTARDWKGKGFNKHSPFDKYHVGVGEQVWDKLDPIEVRRLATSEKARFLPRNLRMAAARDPGLIWDEGTLSYRLAVEATPPPQEAKGGVVGREGASKVSDATPSRPAAASDANANTIFRGESASGAYAREDIGDVS